MSNKNQPDRRWNILENYKQYIFHQDSTTWNVFAIFSAVNAIMIVALIEALRFDSTIGYMILGLFGVVMCFVWLSIIKRSQDYMNVYLGEAQDLEKKIAKPEEWNIDEYSVWNNPRVNRARNKTPSAGKIIFFYIYFMLLWWFAILIFSIIRYINIC